jgi:uncharacterized protein (DUF4213/DUF364 family)
MKWELYDDLINEIPAELCVSHCVVGLHWVAVSSVGTGLAMTPTEGKRRIDMAGRIVGMPVRELARYAKSWNNYEAALGMAAINSVFNTPSRAEGLLNQPLSERRSHTAFEYFREQYRGKRVVVIGHFPKVEELGEICELTVLERRVQDGDVPDPACEYLLPEQDFVFITGATAINKTLPRLLELSRQAFTVLVGPTTPLAPVLFEYGVDALASSVVIDRDAVFRFIQEGACLQVFQGGVRMVQIPRPDSSSN